MSEGEQRERMVASLPWRAPHEQRLLSGLHARRIALDELDALVRALGLAGLGDHRHARVVLEAGHSLSCIALRLRRGDPLFRIVRHSARLECPEAAAVGVLGCAGREATRRLLLPVGEEAPILVPRLVAADLLLEPLPPDGLRVNIVHLRAEVRAEAWMRKSAGDR